MAILSNDDNKAIDLTNSDDDDIVFFASKVDL